MARNGTWKRGRRIVVKTLEKHPNDDLPFSFDFTDWDVLTTSEKITSATVTADVTGLTIASPTINDAGDIVQARISGGTNGQVFVLTCQATTTSGYDIVGCGKLKVVSC